MNYRSSQAFSFPVDKRQSEKAPKKQAIPGPGTYTWEVKPKKTAPKVSFSQTLRPNLYGKPQGPQEAVYEVQEFMGKEGPKYTMSSKAGKNTTVEKELAKIPEPGRYEPNIYAQYSNLGKKISMHQRLSYKELSSENPGPGSYKDRTGMLTGPVQAEKDEQLYCQMSETTKNYIKNYGKVSHGTAKELLRPSTAPKYGFCQDQIVGTDHGMSSAQIMRAKERNEIKKKRQEEAERDKEIERRKFQTQQNFIPKVTRKKKEQLILELEPPKFGFGKYRRGESKVVVQNRPKLLIVEDTQNTTFKVSELQKSKKNK